MALIKLIKLKCGLYLTLKSKNLTLKASEFLWLQVIKSNINELKEKLKLLSDEIKGDALGMKMISRVKSLKKL